MNPKLKLGEIIRKPQHRCQWRKHTGGGRSVDVLDFVRAAKVPAVSQTEEEASTWLGAAGGSHPRREGGPCTYQQGLCFGTAGGPTPQSKAVTRRTRRDAKPLRMHERWENRIMGWVSCPEPTGEHRRGPQTSQGCESSPEHRQPGVGTSSPLCPHLGQPHEVGH